MNKSIFLTPSGAFIAIVCFFLPWVRFSCMGQVREASGADLGESLWIVFACAVLICLSFALFYALKKIVLIKVSTVLFVLVALGIILQKCIEFQNGLTTEYGTFYPQDVGLTLQFGGIGTLIGFTLAFVGAIFSRHK